MYGNLLQKSLINVNILLLLEVPMRKLIHGQSIFRVLTAFLLCFTTMLALSSPVRANAKGASPLAELPVQMEALIEQYQDIMEKNPISFLSWEQADTIFPHNTTVEVIDVETGQRFLYSAFTAPCMRTSYQNSNRIPRSCQHSMAVHIVGIAAPSW